MNKLTHHRTHVIMRMAARMGMPCALLSLCFLHAAIAQEPGTTVLDPLPADFPSITINALNNPAPGELFLAPFIGAGSVPTNANYLIILDNNGKPISYKRVGLGLNPFPYMFKPEPNGVYSYIERTPAPALTTIKVVDTLFNTVDAYPKGDPAGASHADFHILPNGHGLVLYFDKRTIDMSKIVKGGNPAASVQGTLVQEFDLAKNVVFQWSSFDYQPITDTYEDTLAAAIDYSHANNVALDNDGNLLLSNRHMSEITKISRSTGEIIWRLGGKHNQFTFLNEHPENAPLYFSYQHDIQRLPNGNITFFDNGNQKKIQYSRGVEYKLDEVKKTATLVWEYRHTPDIFTTAQGSVQRLPNGNTLIGWGDAGVLGKPTLTEVHPDNSIAFELTLPLGNRSMQVYRLPWRPGRPTASYTRSELLESNTYSFNGAAALAQTGVAIKFNTLSPFFYNSATVEKFAAAPWVSQFAGSSPSMNAQRVVVTQMGMVTIDADVIFDAAQLSGIPDPARVMVYHRDTVGSGVFSPLQTTYNSVQNAITANTTSFGEFIFCWNIGDSLARSPIMVSPLEGDSVNAAFPVGLLWNPRGSVTGFHVQAAADPLFHSLVLNDSLLTVSSDTLRNVARGTKYYWRVRARNGARTGEWSEVRMFTAGAPYISISHPTRGDDWQNEVQYYIQWTSNTRDRVRIELVKDQTRLLTIKDSAANVGAYLWSVPLKFGADTSYRIRIASVGDSTLFGLSENFSLRPRVMGVEESGSRLPVEFILDQNYPNPFNPMTTINFQIPVRTHASLKLYAVTGCEILTLLNGTVDPGYTSVRFDAGRLASGVYFYTLRTDQFVQTKKIILLR
jgi:hypothetical protein